MLKNAAELSSDGSEKPLCHIFGQCGGCQYQHIPYADELSLKERSLRELFGASWKTDETIIDPVVPSPKYYSYRSHLDLKLLRTKRFGVFVGFSPASRNQIIETTTCPIAMPSIDNYLPGIKAEAIPKLKEKHRNANIVIKTGDDGRVVWGGIGRRSLTLKEEDYLWTVVNGRKIFFSLDTFFQANLSILSALIERIRQWDIWGKDVCFYDLYGGVGLFGISLHDLVQKVVLIEENIYAIKLAQYNVAHHALTNFEIFSGRVEDHFAALKSDGETRLIMMVDPPRQGLSESVAQMLVNCEKLQYLIYLSCSPESLMRDLKIFKESQKWEIVNVVPFDFFPRTKHLETLVLLKRL